MDALETVANVLERFKITSIISFIAAVASVASFLTKVLVKDPIERLFKSSTTLFLDYLIKTSGWSFIMTASLSFYGSQSFSVFFPTRNELINYVVASIFLGSLFLLLLSFLQYSFFTLPKRTCFKKTRWFSSIFIASIVLLCTVIVSGYVWEFGNVKTTIEITGFFTLLITVITIGLKQELELVQKNRENYVLRLIGEVEISLLSSHIFHTQTIDKDAQIFEPSHNFSRKVSSKAYYIVYPREQIAIKYTWDKKTNPELAESNLQA